MSSLRITKLYWGKVSKSDQNVSKKYINAQIVIWKLMENSFSRYEINLSKEAHCERPLKFQEF